MQVVLLFPGQGSQKPGMAKDVAEAFPAAKATLDAADKALGVALSTLMFDGPAEELTLEERRKKFAEEVYSDRTRTLTNDLLAQLRKQYTAEIERSAEASLSEVVLSPGVGPR